MGVHKIQTSVPYNFTFPGLVKLYETMDSEYLQALFDRKRTDRTYTLLALRTTCPEHLREWCEKQVEACERAMLTIQQILNARRNVR